MGGGRGEEGEEKEGGGEYYEIEKRFLMPKCAIYAIMVVIGQVEDNLVYNGDMCIVNYAANQDEHLLSR